MPRTSPRACLNAAPSAIALSCVARMKGKPNQQEGDRAESKLICGMVVVDVQIAFATQLERHA